MLSVSRLIWITTALLVVIQLSHSHPSSPKKNTTAVSGRQFEVIGAAIAPALASLVGPFLTSIATGVANTITQWLRQGMTQGRLEAYMLDIPGAQGPYLLVTPNEQIEDETSRNAYFQPGGEVLFQPSSSSSPSYLLRPPSEQFPGWLSSYFSSLRGAPYERLSNHINDDS